MPFGRARTIQMVERLRTSGAASPIALLSNSMMCSQVNPTQARAPLPSGISRRFGVSSTSNSDTTDRYLDLCPVLPMPFVGIPTRYFLPLLNRVPIPYRDFHPAVMQIVAQHNGHFR